MLHQKMTKFKCLLGAVIFLQLTAVAQFKAKDSSRENMQFLFALNNSVSFANYKDGLYPNVKNYNQLEVSLMPKLGYFVLNNLAIGFHYRQGWYWSNFGRSLPNTITRGIFIEYYFLNWKGTKKSKPNEPSKTKIRLNPYVNVSYNRRNFYMGFDSLGLRGAVFNGRNNNFLLTTLLGVNIKTRRKMNFNVSVGLEHAPLPSSLLQQTRYIKTSPVSELGIAYYLRKKPRK